MRERVALAVVLLVGLAIIVSLVVGWGWRDEVASSPEPVVPPAERLAVGAANAPVQIVVYYDPQCPACAMLHEEAEAEIIEHYVPTGEVRLEVRPFAVMGPVSVRAAEATLCAADQGMYWEYRDALFKEYIRARGLAYSAENLENQARLLGLDMSAFRACVEGNHTADEIEALVDQGKLEGVRVIPTMFVNGVKIEGALPYDLLSKLIEELLNR